MFFFFFFFFFFHLIRRQISDFQIGLRLSTCVPTLKARNNCPLKCINCKWAQCDARKPLLIKNQSNEHLNHSQFDLCRKGLIEQMATRRLISQIGKVPNSRIATNLSGHKIPTLNAAPLAAIGKVNIPRIVTLPLACFSTSATAKSDESERVHGKLRTSEVGSKAMRRKIAAEEAEKVREQRL